MVGLAEAVEQSLQAEAHQHELQFVLRFARVIQQTGANGRREILRFVPFHASDSTYGCMTRATRQIFANRSSSSIVPLRLRQ